MAENKNNNEMKLVPQNHESEVMRGTLEAGGLPDYIDFLSNKRKSGRLEVEFHGYSGTVWLDNGTLLAAAADGFVDELAIHNMLLYDKSNFVFIETKLLPKRRIFKDTMSILLEGAKALDEQVDPSAKKGSEELPAELKEVIPITSPEPLPTSKINIGQAITPPPNFSVESLKKTTEFIAESSNVLKEIDDEINDNSDKEEAEPLQKSKKKLIICIAIYALALSVGAYQVMSLNNTEKKRIANHEPTKEEKQKVIIQELKDKVAQLRQNAHELIGKHKFSQAISKLKEAKNSILNSESFAKKVLTKSPKGEGNSTAKIIDNLINLYQKSMELTNFKDEIEKYKKEREFKQALDLCSKALISFPEDRDLKNLKTTLGLLKKEQLQKEKFGVLIIEGDAYIARNENKRAIKTLEDALKISPNNSTIIKKIKRLKIIIAKQRIEALGSNNSAIKSINQTTYCREELQQKIVAINKNIAIIEQRIKEEVSQSKIKILELKLNTFKDQKEIFFVLQEVVRTTFFPTRKITGLNDLSKKADDNFAKENYIQAKKQYDQIKITAENMLKAFEYAEPIITEQYAFKKLIKNIDIDVLDEFNKIRWSNLKKLQFNADNEFLNKQYVKSYQKWQLLNQQLPILYKETLNEKRDYNFNTHLNLAKQSLYNEEWDNAGAECYNALQFIKNAPEVLAILKKVTPNLVIKPMLNGKIVNNANIWLDARKLFGNKTEVPLKINKDYIVKVSYIGKDNKKYGCKEVVYKATKYGPQELVIPLKLVGFPWSLIKQPRAKYASLEGLNIGSKKAQEWQRQYCKINNLALEVKLPRSGIVLRLIPPGEYTIGSLAGFANERPLRKIKIIKAMYVSKFEITQAQWEDIMNFNPAHFDKFGKDKPIESVKWGECQDFCLKLSKFEGLVSDRIRLLTEEEWEYVCRAGTTDDRPAGLNSIAWYSQNSARTLKVGGKSANAWGIHDMLGNVWEWCDSWYSIKKKEKVFRGGSWQTSPKNIRSSCRFHSLPSNTNNQLGLRIILPAK